MMASTTAAAVELAVNNWRVCEVYYANSEELKLPGSLIREGQLCVVMWPVDNVK